MAMKMAQSQRVASPSARIHEAVHRLRGGYPPAGGEFAARAPVCTVSIEPLKEDFDLAFLLCGEPLDVLGLEVLGRTVHSLHRTQQLLQPHNRAQRRAVEDPQLLQIFGLKDRLEPIAELLPICEAEHEALHTPSLAQVEVNSGREQHLLVAEDCLGPAQINLVECSSVSKESGHPIVLGSDASALLAARCEKLHDRQPVRRSNLSVKGELIEQGDTSCGCLVGCVVDRVG